MHVAENAEPECRSERPGVLLSHLVVRARLQCDYRVVQLYLHFAVQFRFQECIAECLDPCRRDGIDSCRVVDKSVQNMYAWIPKKLAKHPPCNS